MQSTLILEAVLSAFTYWDEKVHHYLMVNNQSIVTIHLLYGKFTKKAVEITIMHNSVHCIKGEINMSRIHTINDYLLKK